MTLPDQADRIRALTDHTSTLLVEAGAGSGKTSLMAGRVALMLAGGIPPRNIAAITFTELAAGQLFSRIAEFVDELLDGKIPYNMKEVLPDGLGDIQRQNLDQARQHINELTATTIHGFCQQLVRPYPVEANVDPGARVMDEADASLAWQDMLKRFLRDRLDKEDDGGALAAFVEVAGNRSELAIVTLAAFLRRHRTARPADIAFTHDAVDSFESAVDAFSQWLNGVGYVEATTADLATELRDLSDAFGRHLGGDVDDAKLVRLAVDPLPCSALTQKFAWRAWGRKGKWETAAAAGGSSKAEGGRVSGQGDVLYKAVGEAWLHLQGMIAAAGFRALAIEFDELLKRYGAYKREAALLDFDDLLLKAVELLRTNEQVRRALADRYTKVLVDEFQDTDPFQAEILWRLCGEGDDSMDWRARSLRDGALFCVGDPKQAIYRFRGADVDTYVEAREAIRRQFPDNVLEITANFRSLRPILDWVNERFAGHLSADGQPGFQNLASTQEPNDNLPRVARLDIDVDSAGDKVRQNEAREAEASAVAEFCQRLIGSYRLQDKGRAEDPFVKPGDIALLAPGGTQLWRYERALEQAGIPVASQAGKGFFRRQEIQDLIAITRTLSDNRDTVAFGALMRGPLVGLTEENILDIVEGLPAPDDKTRIPRYSLWTTADKVVHPLARDVVTVLQGLATRARSTTPFELLAEAIEELRVRPILKQRHPGGAERALANVDLFLEMARPYDVRGLGAFASDMRTRWENAEAEIEGRPDAEEQAVHLITMHSAKGLEWPIVIPVNTMTDPRSESGLLFDRSSDTVHHHLGPVQDSAYEEILENERAQQDRERIRLLYVACTRAAELLIIPTLSTGKSGWLGLMDLGLADLAPFDVGSYAADLPPTVADIGNTQDGDTFASEAARVVRSTRTIQWRQPSRHEMSEDDAEVAEAVATVIVEDDIGRLEIQGGPRRGTILHKLMEEVLTGEVPADPDYLQARSAELMSQLGETSADDPAHGLVPSELANSVVKTLALPAISALADRLRPEFAVYGFQTDSSDAQNEVALSGVADAVALGPDGRIEVVVDWKSDISPDAATREKYRSQVRDYLEASGAARGLVVYMTLGQVDEVSAV